MASGIPPDMEPGFPAGGKNLTQGGGRGISRRPQNKPTPFPGGRDACRHVKGFPLAKCGFQFHFIAMLGEQQPSAESSPSNPLVAGLHFRGKLPHLKKEGTVYFVTFRLADSLPAHEVTRLKHERKAILERARAAKSPLTWHEEQQLLAWYCKVETLLDVKSDICRRLRGWEYQGAWVLP